MPAKPAQEGATGIYPLGLALARGAEADGVGEAEKGLDETAQAVQTEVERPHGNRGLGGYRR